MFNVSEHDREKLEKEKIKKNLSCDYCFIKNEYEYLSDYYLKYMYVTE